MTKSENCLKMNGLVSGYGSDSEEEEANEPKIEEKGSNPKGNFGQKNTRHKIRQLDYIFTDWMECMDNTTGYPYYWNRISNVVKWDRPSEMPALPKSVKKTSSISSAAVPPKEPQQKVKKKGRSKSPPQVFIGPTLPQLSPEETARQKVIKFEEAMAIDIEAEIKKEDPPDWKEAKPHKGLYNKPFAWKKSSTSLTSYRQLEAQLKKASQSMSMIAGVYADDDSADDENETESSPTKKIRRSGISVKVRQPVSKQAKPLLKEVPGIFRNNDTDEEEVKNEDKSDEPPKKKRRWGMLPKMK